MRHNSPSCGAVDLSVNNPPGNRGDERGRDGRSGILQRCGNAIKFRQNNTDFHLEFLPVIVPSLSNFLKFLVDLTPQTPISRESSALERRGEVASLVREFTE